MPIHYSSLNGHAAALDALLEAGADAAAEDEARGLLWVSMCSLR